MDIFFGQIAEEDFNPAENFVVADKGFYGRVSLDVEDLLETGYADVVFNDICGRVMPVSYTSLHEMRAAIDALIDEVEEAFMVRAEEAIRSMGDVSLRCTCGPGEGSTFYVSR